MINVPHNKGSYLESLINYTIKNYKDNNIALITKAKSQIYVKNNSITFANITNYTVNLDYFGIYQGLYLEFDAKETIKSYFSLSNIKKTQIQRLKEINTHKGCGFIIVCFKIHNLFYVLTYNQILEFQKNKINKVDINWFKKNGYKIFVSYPLKLDFIKWLLNNI